MQCVELISKAYDIFAHQHTNVMLTSWRNTGLLLPFDGSKDAELDVVY